jgi:hypothetical protein
MLAGASLMVACDRKSEQHEEVLADAAVEPTVVEQTTVAALETIPSDAGPDATALVVGVAVTKIATKGNPVVVDEIANARCQREQGCGNVGKDRKYASGDACREKIAGEWVDDLNRFDCPGGYDKKELDECLEEIRNEDCKNPFDTLGRILACRASDICISKR